MIQVASVILRVVGSSAPAILGAILLRRLRRGSGADRTARIACWLLIAGGLMELSLLAFRPPRPPWLGWWFASEALLCAAAWAVAGALLWVRALRMRSQSGRRRVVVALQLGGEVFVLGLVVVLCLAFFGRRMTRREGTLQRPYLAVDQSDRRLVFTDQHGRASSFRVALGLGGVGAKQHSGDGKPPVGRYHICERTRRSFGGFLRLDYPNAHDATRGRRDGLITWWEWLRIRVAIASERQPPQTTNLGGAIAIHGGGSQGDWTGGCIAVDNTDLDVFYDQVGVGTPVIVRE